MNRLSAVGFFILCYNNLMINHNFFTYAGKIIGQILGEILYFPVWWYTVGFARTAKGGWRFWRGRESSLGFGVWVKNIFVPMYGQRDLASRLISFVMRLVQIIYRGAILLFWLVLILLFLVLWLAGPILLLLALAFQI
ncbi:TPA: hypothetical protein DCZ15_03745 [Candidatus Falkowbacteria bacterium]|nr:hypothetical protein [Candidatus Falkowbacteria bacterium]